MQERLRLRFVAHYLLLVLLAFYMLRPVSRAMFLKKIDIDCMLWLRDGRARRSAEG